MSYLLNPMFVCYLPVFQLSLIFLSDLYPVCLVCL